MQNGIAKVVEEFVKHSPAAWEAMCRYHQAQAAGRIAGFMVACLVFGIAFRRILPRLKKKAEEGSGSEKVDAGVFTGFLVIIGLCLVFWGAREMPAAWGSLFAPERDAARDVLNMTTGGE